MICLEQWLVIVGLFLSGGGGGEARFFAAQSADRRAAGRAGALVFGAAWLFQSGAWRTARLLFAECGFLHRSDGFDLPFNSPERLFRVRVRA